MVGFNALILTTVGRKSGLERTNPVGWFPAQTAVGAWCSGVRRPRANSALQAGARPAPRPPGLATPPQLLAVTWQHPSALVWLHPRIGLVVVDDYPWLRGQPTGSSGFVEEPVEAGCVDPR
jgi:hypothetical protein